MWSVVVLPLVLTRIGRSTKSVPSQATKGQRGDEVGAGDERQRGGAAVVAAGKVPVERADDGVGLVGADVRALPLPDARPARVGQDGAADPRKRVDETVAL